MDEARGIGRDQRLPWKIPEDLLHFRRTTWHHTIVMGRKTYESIGRTLPERRTIVVSRTLKEAPRGTVLCASLKTALKLAQDDPRGDVFIAGGAEIYAQVLPMITRMVITHVPGEHDCDTFFPEFDAHQWRRVGNKNLFCSSADLDFQVGTYQRNT